MRAGSLDFPPDHGKAIHQVIDQLSGVIVCAVGEVGIFGRGQNAAMTEDSLNFEEVDARFDQMSCKTVPQAVWSNLFFIPQACTT